MKRVSWLVIVYIIIAHSSELGEGITQWFAGVHKALRSAHHRTKRSLFEFEDVITCLQPWVDVLTTYSDYGCYCGYKGNGQPLDDTDKCCYYHDKCYTAAEEGAASFSAYFAQYEFKCENNSRIICDEEGNSGYANAYCECDRLASECFLQARRSYTPLLFNINTGKYCKKSDLVYCIAINIYHYSPGSEKPDLSDLNIKRHTLDKLYSCNMKFDDDRCCSDLGYNSEYSFCCNGVVKNKDEDCPKHNEL